MDIIEQKAYDFIEDNLDLNGNSEDLITLIEDNLSLLRTKLDRIKYLNVVVQYIRNEESEHAPACKSPTKCTESKLYAESLYFLDQILSEFEVGLDNSQVFTESEKEENNDKLDSILEEINKLRAGQEIIYDDVIKEINELKNLYFLGKKNWKQIVAGKTLEMIVSGVVSETISKKLINVTTTDVANLLLSK